MFAQSAMLVDDAFGDDRVQATLGSRTGALFGQRVTHKRARADADGACRKAWRSQWKDIAAQGVLSEIKRWAIMEGFAVSEILWDTTVTPWRMTLKPWHPQFIYYRWDIRRLVASTMDGPVIIEPGDGKWFVHAPFGIYRGWIHAAVRAIADKWMIKQLAWRDWARFNERHGLPIIKAYVPAAGDARQKELFVRSMASMGQEAVVGLPQNVDETGYDLELLEARDRAWETFKGAIEAADRSIILTIKSQNLTTEVAEGSFAAARQHGNTEQVTLEFDNSTFSYDLFTQVARPFAKFNFGDQEKACFSSWDVTPFEDRAVAAKTILDASTALTALKSAGVPVDVTAYARTFRIPLDPNAKQAKSATIFQYHIDAGVVTVNEVRASLGLEPRPDGDAPTTADPGAADAPAE
jgi:phage gp29-like protein